MTEVDIDDILAQLTGPRDKHVIAHAYNCQSFYPVHSPPTISVGVRKLQLFRRLGLITKRPGHERIVVEKADHILSERGMRVGKAINRRFKLALAVPPL